MARGRPLEIEAELIEAFTHCGRVSEYLVGIVPDAFWRADPPGGRGRTIAAIVAHMQSVRRTFARLGGLRPGPPSLDRSTVTRLQAARALRQSTDDLARMFTRAIEARQTRVAGMPRRVVNMIAYLIQHDAHHRGQICALARDFGHQFRGEEVMRLWGWKALVTAPPQPGRPRRTRPVNRR
jgi:uncharacterized damage-inducible protein DinB